MADKIQFRRDTAARWAEVNPILLSGEIGLVTDSENKYKLGDGIHTWNELPLQGFNGTLVDIPGTDTDSAMSQKGATDLVSEYNVSTNNSNAEYTFAQAVALVPASLQKGGLTIKYIDSTTHEYAIKRLMSSTWNTTESNWQGIDDEPTAGSDNLVKSGGVYNELHTLSEQTQTRLSGDNILSDNTSDTLIVSSSTQSGNTIFYVYVKAGNTYYINASSDNIYPTSVAFFTEEPVVGSVGTKIFNGDTNKVSILYTPATDGYIGFYRYIWWFTDYKISDVVNIGRANSQQINNVMLKQIPLHKSLPMLSGESSPIMYSSYGVQISPEITSKFIIDVKLEGSAQESCIYAIKVQYDKEGSLSYSNCIFLQKSTNGGESWTDLLIYYLGANAPEGVQFYSLNVTDDYVSKLKILLDYRSLLNLPRGINYIVIELTPSTGYLLDNDYIFDTEDVLSPIHTIEKLNEINPGRGQFGLEIQLPNTIYAVVGTEVNLWNDTIAYSVDKGLISPMNYYLLWHDSTIGMVTKRGFRFTPEQSHVGHTYSVTCKLYNLLDEIVATKTFNIKVVAKDALNSSKNIVFFGDSLGGSTVAALHTNFTNTSKFSGVIPTFLGTKSNGGSSYHFEAVGGYRWADYATAGRRAFRCTITNFSGSIPLESLYTNNGKEWKVVEVNITDGNGNILITREELWGGSDAPETNGTLVAVLSGGTDIPYTNATLEGANPLWNDAEQKIDVAYYKQVLGLQPIDKIDAVFFQLGLNWPGYPSPEEENNYIRSLYNAFITDNANCKVIIGLTTTSGNTVDGAGANYGAGENYISHNKTMFEQRKRYLNLVGVDMPNLLISPSYTMLDRYYGYSFSQRYISQRFQEEEKYHNNYLHPESSGYGQLADAAFASIIGVLTDNSN